MSLVMQGVQGHDGTLGSSAIMINLQAVRGTALFSRLQHVLRIPCFRCSTCMNGIGAMFFYLHRSEQNVGLAGKMSGKCEAQRLRLCVHQDFGGRKTALVSLDYWRRFDEWTGTQTDGPPPASPSATDQTACLHGPRLLVLRILLIDD